MKRDGDDDDDDDDDQARWRPVAAVEEKANKKDRMNILALIPRFSLCMKTCCLFFVNQLTTESLSPSWRYLNNYQYSIQQCCEKVNRDTILFFFFITVAITGQ